MEKLEVKCENCGGMIRYHISVKMELEHARPSERGVFTQAIQCQYCKQPQKLTVLLNNDKKE